MRSLIITMPALLLAVLLGAPAAAGQEPRPVVKGDVPRHRHDASCRKWIPPRVEVVETREWVPGSERRVWHPPVYRTERDARGNLIQVMAKRGYYETVKEPGRFEVVKKSVHREGRWVRVCGH